MAATRIESSIVASLGELKSIHLQRIADERSAAQRARAEEVAAAQRQVDAIREAEAARIRAAHEAEVALHAARAAAEREARLRAAQDQAAEQARLDAELAARRQAEELALRREDVRKRRPRWMLAVTAFAVCAAVGGGWLAVEHQREATAAHQREEDASRQRLEALHEVAEIEQQMQTADKELATLRDKVDVAVKQVIDAQTDADRKKAQQAVIDERTALADQQHRRAELERQRQEQIRKGGLNFAGCANTALGCLDK